MYKFIVVFILLISIVSCDPYKNPYEDREFNHEILIYTGITMSDAVFELKSLFEADNDCNVLVMYGASGYLKHVVEVNRKGDIFFPGNISYIDSFKTDHVVTRQLDIGYNSLSFFVAKNNPLQLNSSLDQLTNPDLRVVIGSDDAGSVGRETRYLLEQHGMYDAVVGNVTAFATDSKGIATAVKSGNADIVINWRAAGLTKKNISSMTQIDIDSAYNRKVPIAMGLLKYSTDNTCANKFMDFAASDVGNSIFAKYGFAK